MDQTQDQGVTAAPVQPVGYQISGTGYQYQVASTVSTQVVTKGGTAGNNAETRAMVANQ